EDKTSKKNWISEFKEYLTKKLKGLTEYIIRGIPGGGFLADWLFDEDKSLDNSGSSRGRFKTRDERLMEREVQKRKREREKSKTSQSKNNGDLDKLRDKLSSQKDTAKYIRDSSFERPSHQMGITGTALKNKDKDIVDDNITVSDLLKNELDEKTAKLLKHQLTVHEGIALKKYIDSRGYPTIGVGHKIESDEKFPKKISYSKAMELFSEDLIEHTSDAKRLPFFNQLDSVRKAAIIDMVYNMGVGGVKKFRSMTQYLKEGDYKNAASEILNSRYSEQVGKRAESIAKLIKSGDPKYFNIGEPQIIAADRGMITSRPTPTIVGEENRPEAVVPLTKERFRNFTRNIDIDSLRNERDELLNSDDNIQESSNIQTNVNNQNEQQPRRENNKPMILNTPSINSGRRDDEKPTKTKIDDDMDMIIDRIFNNSSATFIETVKEYTFGNTASHKFY
ncbi:MAG: glycoside hydrolase family protein, partial [bacterium]